MHIYNVTSNVKETSHEAWLRWMKTTQIPNILATGKFVDIKISRVLVEEEMGGITYATQYSLEDSASLVEYLTEDASKLKIAEDQLFSGDIVTFATELEVLYEQTADAAKPKHHVFAYGHLQNDEIQMRVFKKIINGHREVLKGYTISDKMVADKFPAKESSGPLTTDVDGGLEGTVLSLTETQLKLVDAFEGNLYERMQVLLLSGLKVWIYIAR